MKLAPDPSFALLVADVYELAGVLRRYGDQVAGTAGQTQARWQLMSVISTGEWTIPHAADRLGTSRQAVQRVANDLAVDELAEFTTNPNHQRSPFLALTAKGRRVLAQITEQARVTHADIAGALDQVDLARLRDDVRRVSLAVRDVL